MRDCRELRRISKPYKDAHRAGKRFRYCYFYDYNH